MTPKKKIFKASKEFRISKGLLLRSYTVSYIIVKASNSTLHYLQLAAGETLVLTCRAQGIPKPNITWYKDKQANRLAGAIGEVLTIDHISHEDSGNYRCLADNAVDPPAHANITIEVLRKYINLFL